MLYTITVRDINHLYNEILPTLKETWHNKQIVLIESNDELSNEITSCTNFGLFTQNVQPKILLIYKLSFSTQDISKLNKTSKEHQIILANCKTPKDAKIQKLNITQKKLTIKDAQNRLAKYLSYQEIQKILPALLADNSDYYINRASLQTLEKQLALAQNNQNLKNAILKNIQKLSINQFNLLKAFLIYPLPDAIEFFNKYLETHNLFELTASLKSQLKIAYWLKKYSPQEVEKKLKKNPFYIKSIKQTTEKFSAYKILDFIFSLENLETGIKNGKYSDPNNTFYLLIIKSRNK